MASIHTYGDSITYGIGDSEGGGYASRLRSSMMERMMEPVEGRRSVIVHNFARLAMTLPQIVAELPANLTSRDGHGRLIAVTMVGFSDSLKPKSASQPTVPLDKFRHALMQFTTICNDAPYPIHRLFIELPPVDLSRPHPEVPDDTNPVRIAKYQEVLETHAHETGAIFTKTHDALQNLPQDPLSRDGIHPSVVGHIALHNLLLPHVDDLLS